MEIEEWIPAKGFEGFYECSTFGRIRSVYRWVKARNNGNRFNKGQILKYCVKEDGYLMTGFSVLSKHYSIIAHNVIFWSFNPDIKKQKGYEIDHIDNDKTNLRPSNLRYITNRENASKAALTLNKTSKYTGVSFSKQRNKFCCFIKVNCKSINLGRFEDEEKANNVYQKALEAVNDGIFSKELIKTFRE